LTDHPIVTNIADWFYLRMQQMSRRLAYSTKRSSKTFLRCADRVRSEAIAYAAAKYADVVVCGHTHCPEAPLFPDSAGCTYYNAGSWCDYHCHYLSITGGNVQLVEANADTEVPALAGV
jgi:UDP-2,3-diacylglucosamine pyrophosphatase LpxH